MSSDGQFSTRANTLAATRGDLVTSQRDLTREQSVRIEVEAALSNAQERLTKEQQAWAIERERMKAELLLEQSAIKHLRQERDDAMREAARQEGKVSALIGQLDGLKSELAAVRDKSEAALKPV